MTSVDIEAPARALALILSADGSLSAHALRVLEGLGAFEQLEVSRQRLVELASDCTKRIDPGLCERSWLSAEDIAQTDAVIEAVESPEQRALVCRLAAAAIEDDGLVTHGARLVFGHMLARWRIAPAMLSQERRQGLAG
jgi:alanine dehydrogenase